ncbi:MAG TPA: hypothetical protein VMV87_14490 [Burkholderiales bacterium]|nr:hypothetical protein [Burkholderiales bacterium]
MSNDTVVSGPIARGVMEAINQQAKDSGSADYEWRYNWERLAGRGPTGAQSLALVAVSPDWMDFYTMGQQAGMAAVSRDARTIRDAEKELTDYRTR